MSGRNSPNGSGSQAVPDPSAMVRRLVAEFIGLEVAGLVVAGGGVALVEPFVSGSRGLSILALSGAALLVLGLAAALAVRQLRRAFPATGDPDVLRVVSLPVRLAVHHLAAWLVVGVVSAALLLSANLLRIDRSFMVLLACALAGMGTALAARVRTTLAVMPLLTRLLDASGEPPRPQTTLRRRLTLVLGGLVFFSSAFGLFAVFAMQRDIVGHYVTQKGEEFRRAARALLADRGEFRCASLTPILPEGGAIFWHHGRSSCATGLALPDRVVGFLEQAPEGPLTLPNVDLEGVRLALDDEPGAPVLTLLVPRPEWTRRVLLASLVFYTLLFLFSAYLAALVSRSLTSPIEVLKRQLERIARGELENRVGLSSLDEIGQLSLSADAMRRGLQEMVRTIRELNLGLEEKVEERTRQLAAANHELRTAMDQLKQTQSHLVHAEKMASLGRLMTGLAHELNNPVNAILNTIGPLRTSLSGLADEVEENRLARLLRASNTVERAAQRTVDLIRSMGSFTRAGEQVRKPTDINDAVEATWVLLQHRVDGQRCRVNRELGDLPDIEVVPGEISQVLMNLFANALDAVAPRRSDGQITVTSRAEADAVVVTVSDNGPGIPEAVREHIFEPFFTTRDEGSGLGLAISDDVVRRHRGTLAVDDGPLGGARFTLRLPLEAATSGDESR